MSTGSKKVTSVPSYTSRSAAWLTAFSRIFFACISSMESLMTSTAAATRPTSTASKVVYHRVTRVLMLSRFRFMAI